MNGGVVVGRRVGVVVGVREGRGVEVAIAVKVGEGGVPGGSSDRREILEKYGARISKSTATTCNINAISIQRLARLRALSRRA